MSHVVYLFEGRRVRREWAELTLDDGTTLAGWVRVDDHRVVIRDGGRRRSVAVGRVASIRLCDRPTRRAERQSPLPPAVKARLRSAESEPEPAAPVQRTTSTGDVLASGAACGVAFSIHYYCVFLALPLAWAVLRAHRGRQNAVSRLRQALGKELIETRAPGYVLRIDPGAIDARRFERLVHDAKALPPAERSAACNCCETADGVQCRTCAAAVTLPVPTTSRTTSSCLRSM